jgi:lipopolysaccharide exporter
MTEDLTPGTSENLGARIARGAAWMVLFKLIERSIGFVSTLILARLLVPEDFGLVAMAMSVVALTEIMGAFGFDTALIQRPNATRAHYDTAWTYNVLVGVVIAIILLLLATPVASFYREPRLVSIIPLLALSTFIQSFANIGTVAFRKELNFRRDFGFMLSRKLFSFLVTMTLAFTIASYWALIGGTIAGAIFGVVASYGLHPYRPRFCLAASKDLLQFSKWLLANNLIFLMQNRSTDFLLGRAMGAHTLGVYNIAFEIATMPSTELVAPLNRAALPGYAKIANDLPRLRQGFLRMIGIIAMFAFPVGIGLASIADPAVRLLLGAKWIEAIPLIQILAVYGVINALQSNIGQVYVALGMPKVITLMAGGVLIPFVPSLYFASIHYGVTGAAAVFLIFSVITMPMVHFIFFRLTSMRVLDYLAATWRPMVAAVLMGCVITVLRGLLNAAGLHIPVALQLVTCILIGAVVFTAAVVFLWYGCGRPAGAEAFIVDALYARLARSRPASHAHQ